jgi:PleD family two-component response regulator
MEIMDPAMDASAVSILVVDDNRFDRELTRWALTRLAFPCCIQEASSWEVARPIVDAGGVDLVLLDHNLPGTTGLEALAELRTRDARPVVVMLTGDDDADAVAATLRAGAHDCVVKSVDWGPTLARAVERTFEHIFLHRESATVRGARSR